MCVHWRGSPLCRAMFPPPSVTPPTESSVSLETAETTDRSRGQHGERQVPTSRSFLLCFQRCANPWCKPWAGVWDLALIQLVTSRDGRSVIGGSPERAGNPRLSLLLAAAMFVLVVDTSLMNVSISA